MSATGQEIAERATNLTAPLKCDFARSFDGKSCNQRQPLDTESWCEECAWNLQTEDFRAAINDERAIAAAVIRERDEARALNAELAKALELAQHELSLCMTELSAEVHQSLEVIENALAAVVRLPSVTARMKWWVQQFDAALARAKAGAR